MGGRKGTTERLTCRILQRSDRHSMSSHGWYMPRVTQFSRMTSMLTHSNQVHGVKDELVAAWPRGATLLNVTLQEQTHSPFLPPTLSPVDPSMTQVQLFKDCAAGLSRHKGTTNATPCREPNQIKPRKHPLEDASGLTQEGTVPREVPSLNSSAAGLLLSPSHLSAEAPCFLEISHKPPAG